MNKVEEQAVVDDYAQADRCVRRSPSRATMRHTKSRPEAEPRLAEVALMALAVSRSTRRQSGLHESRHRSARPLPRSDPRPLAHDRKAVDQIIATLRRDGSSRLGSRCQPADVAASSPSAAAQRAVSDGSGRVLDRCGRCRVCSRPARPPGTLFVTGRLSSRTAEDLPRELRTDNARRTGFSCDAGRSDAQSCRQRSKTRSSRLRNREHGCRTESWWSG